MENSDSIQLHLSVATPAFKRGFQSRLIRHMAFGGDQFLRYG